MKNGNELLPEYSDNAEKLVVAAKKYLNRLIWIMTNGVNYIYYTYDNNSCHRWLAANDFLLLFSEMHIPPLQQAVEAKHRNLVLGEPINFENEYYLKMDDNKLYRFFDNTELYMNCWSFTTLAMYDAGIVTKQQIQNIITIINADKSLDLINAFYQVPIQPYLKCCQLALPKPGDLLLFVKKGEKKPYHAAITIDQQGNYIDLYYGGAVMIVNLDSYFKIEAPALGNEIYCIPLDSIPNNISQFINTHNHHLNDANIEKENHLLSDFEGTQYRPIVESNNRNSDSFFLPIPSGRFRNCINTLKDYMSSNNVIDNESLTLANKIIAQLKGATHQLGGESAEFNETDSAILAKPCWLTDILNIFPKSKEFILAKLTQRNEGRCSTLSEEEVGKHCSR